MFPVLYEQNETNFAHLGLGVMRNLLSCFVIEERNGAFELRMTLPLDSTLAEIIKTDMIIKADASHQKTGQLFRIKRITRTKDNAITIVAYHVSYLTRDLAMNPEFTLNGTGIGAMNGWLANIIDDSPITVSSNVPVGNRSLSMRIGEFDNARDVLGKILETWGGNYRINNYHIELRDFDETEADTLISYGRNLTDLTQEENISQTFTSIQPYAIVREANADGEAIQRIVTSTPDIVDSANVNKFPNRRILPVDFSSQIANDETDIAGSLMMLANAYIKDHNIGVPKVSLKVSFVDLSKALNFSGLQSEKLELGNVLPVYFEKLGIRSRAPINRVEWNVLTGSYNQVELGEVKLNLADRVRDVENGMNTALTRPPVIDGSNIANIPPGPITNLRAIGGFSQIQLFWDMQGIHIDYYEIQRSQTRDSGFTHRARSRTSTFSDTVEVNQQFFYRVRAVNFHGVVGDWSESEGARTADALDVVEHEHRLGRVREIVEEWCYDYPDTVTIDGGNIEANTITARQIDAKTITGLEIAAETIEGTHIKSYSITTEHMEAGSISGDIITAGTLSADAIEGGSMSADFIHGGSIKGSVFETYNNSNSARLLRIDNQGLHFSATNPGTGSLRWTNGLGQFDNVNLSSTGAVNLRPGGRNIEFRANGELHGALLDASSINRGFIDRSRVSNVATGVQGRTGRFQVGNMLIQTGIVSITPWGANTQTLVRINFPSSFTDTPNVQVGASTTVMGNTVLGVSANAASSTGVDIILLRTNTTPTTIRWVAIGGTW